jgi:hypothetical protein
VLREIRGVVLRETVLLLTTAFDFGPRRPDAGAVCDLCNAPLRPPAWLLGWHEGLEVYVGPDGPGVRRFVNSDPRDGLWLVCPRCYGLLRADPGALVRRLVQAHAESRN